MFTTVTGMRFMSGGRLARAVALVLSLFLLFSTLLIIQQKAWAAISIAEFPVPTAGSTSFDMALGSDGNFWFTEYSGNKIGKCAIAGIITNEYPLPNANSQPSYIVSGPDGNLWFTEFNGDRIGKITPSGVITEYNVPTAGSFSWGLTVGPDGALWFTELNTNKVGRCTTSGAITEFPIPGGTSPRAITRGPDGNLWFVEGAGNTVDRMTTAGAVTRYPIPTAGSQPWGICMGQDGNLWFTEAAGNKVSRCTAVGGITEYVIPTAASAPIGINPGPDGALWFCERDGNKIGRCSLTGVISETNVPTAASQPTELVNATDGSIWFGETAGNKLGRLEGYPTSSWYLAEGVTEWGFSTYITVENPNAAAAHVNVTYMPKGAPPMFEAVALPANSQMTLTNDHLLAVMGAPRDFSTRIVCAEGFAIAVDRTMQWTGPGASAPELHNSIGVTSPARRWYLAEGSSNWGFECFLLIQNPTAYTANCQVTYMIEGEGPQTFTKTVGPNSRETYAMVDDIGAKDTSIEVLSNVPVIPERAMYRNDRREGHDSIGTPAPALKYYLAEGTTAWNFMTFLLVQNPNPQPVDVTVTYQTAGGDVPQPAFQMDPNSRKTINVNTVMPGVDLSTTVEGTLPIIAERAMYLPSPSGEICHDSIGMDSAHSTFYLPDGQTSEGCETYTLVQNPNGVPVDIQIDYLMAGGAGNSFHGYTLDPNSRRTFKMNDVVSGRGAVKVTCTSGHNIMVERAMYWNSRQAATDTIGRFTD